MKAVKVIVITAIIFGSGLAGCRTNPSFYQQVASSYSGCNYKDIQISDETSDLNSDETWTAMCEDRTYRCSYHSSAGADCIEITE